MRRSARWALGILGELLSNAKPGRRYAGPPITTNGGGRALVTGGTGGIGEEVCRGLAARGYDVYVGARDAAKGEAVAERLREEFPGAHKCLVCDLNGGDTALPRGVNLLVNTTSLGMAGQPPLEIALDDLPATALVNDIVYSPLVTDLLARAKGRGNPVVDGLGMLLHQGRTGFEAWFGVAPSVTPELREAVLAD